MVRFYFISYVSSNGFKSMFSSNCIKNMHPFEFMSVMSNDYTLINYKEISS